MDDPIPPSYTEAISRDWLSIVAHYLDDSCLCSALRVSRRWHNILAPCLWREPAKHFGRKGEGVYAAFTRFQRSLPRVRSRVRQLTHTLYLKPSRNDFHDGPQAQWFQDILENLPNLRCLIVSGIPFFDHKALAVLESRSKIYSEYPLGEKLRLLIAAQCINCTYGRLESALQRFQHLIFLDLSRTPAARDEKVLLAIESLQDLQILKLRGVRLQDDDFRVLADPFNTSQTGMPMPRRTLRLRSLDIRDNLLTDKSVKLLIERMILSDPPSYDNQHHGQIISRANIQEPAQSFRVASQAMQDLRRIDLEKQFVGLLSRSDHADALLQQLDNIGLTHVYLAGNEITDEGIMGLLEIKHLHVLDFGDWQDAIESRRPRLPDHLVNRQNSAPVTSGTRRIVRSFESSVPPSELTYLRASHEIVTTSAQTETQEPFKGTQAVSNSLTDLPSYEQRNGGFLPSISSGKPGTSAVETIEDSEILGGNPQLLSTARGASTEQDAFMNIFTMNSSTNIASKRIQSEIEHIISRRQSLRHKSHIGHRGLLPGQLPNLEALVLTSIPRLTQSAQLIQYLKDFIKDCATEHYLATEQARLEYTVQRTRKVSNEIFISQRAQQLFALRKITLEMVSPRSKEPLEVSPTSPSSGTFPSKTKSAVEDRDVDVFWEASKDDFSFFDGKEDDLSDWNRGHTHGLSNASVRLDSYARREPSSADDFDISSRPLRDVVAEIAAWRTEKKKRQQHGAVAEVWPGKIEVLSSELDNAASNTNYYVEALG